MVTLGTCPDLGLRYTNYVGALVLGTGRSEIPVGAAGQHCRAFQDSEVCILGEPVCSWALLACYFLACYSAWQDRPALALRPCLGLDSPVHQGGVGVGIKRMTFQSTNLSSSSQVKPLQVPWGVAKPDSLSLSVSAAVVQAFDIKTGASSSIERKTK